jgi:UTP-glucose-1-phosphate uridylyltransferase
VLVARAFNHVYDLKLTTRAEMEAAYQGEILTPSRCGRMDQGCAFGQVPVHMTFDGDLLKTRRVRVGRHICMLVADLKGHKDTIRILAELNRAYPFAEDEAGRRVQEYLGPVNADIVEQALRHIEAGDARALGALMRETQRLFDAHLAPACPDELTAPKLPAVLAAQTVADLTFGGKGVGSQGDGCVQFVTRGEEERKTLSAYLADEYGMECFPLDLVPPKAVRKAIVPAAGFGTRLFPATKAVKKELFPIITPDGVCKPILLAIIEEALESGIEEIAVIVRPDDEAIFRDFFQSLPPPEHYNKLPERVRRYCHALQEIGTHITFIRQEEALGFGHAVHCAKDWVDGEPFLLLLGDHIYASTCDRPCSRQLIDAFEANGLRSVIGVYIATAEEVPHYGTITGEWISEDESLLNISEIAEKPSLDYARNNLVTPRLEPDRFVCVYGQYVLTARIFDYLEHQIETDQRQAGEIQLTTALESLRQDEGMLGCVVRGEHYDTGLPENYLESLVAFHRGGSDNSDTAEPEPAVEP